MVSPEVWAVGAGRAVQHLHSISVDPHTWGVPMTAFWGQQGDTWGGCVCCPLEFFWKVCNFVMCVLHY